MINTVENVHINRLCPHYFCSGLLVQNESVVLFRCWFPIVVQRIHGDKTNGHCKPSSITPFHIFHFQSEVWKPWGTFCHQGQSATYPTCQLRRFRQHLGPLPDRAAHRNIHRGHVLCRKMTWIWYYQWKKNSSFLSNPGCQIEWRVWWQQKRMQLSRWLHLPVQNSQKVRKQISYNFSKW